MSMQKRHIDTTNNTTNTRVPFTDRLDNGARFVAEDTGEETFGVVSVERVNVRVAQRIGHDLDADFTGAGWGHGDGFQRQWLLGSPRDHGLAGNWFADRVCGGKRRNTRF